MTRPAAIRPVSVEENFINACVYGEPGVGKSVLAGTAPKSLILCNDPNELASASIHGSKADMWVVRDYNDLEEAVQWVRREGLKQYEWVILDNGTLFQEQGMDHIMADLIARNPHRDPFVPDKPQYLVNQNHFSSIIRQLKALPIHFLITAHVMKTVDQEGRIVYLPAFQGGQGQFSQKLCGYMGVVGYMTASRKEQGIQRTLFLDKRQLYVAKDRFSSTPNGRLVNPTIPKLMEGIQARLPTLGKPASGNGKARATKVTKATKAAKSTRRA